MVDSKNYYATYQKRSSEDGGRVVKLPRGNVMVDNSWVVPYNPFMSLRYHCRINMECCASLGLVDICKSGGVWSHMRDFICINIMIPSEDVPEDEIKIVTVFQIIFRTLGPSVM